MGCTSSKDTDVDHSDLSSANNPPRKRPSAGKFHFSESDEQSGEAYRNPLWTADRGRIMADGGGSGNFIFSSWGKKPKSKPEAVPREPSEKNLRYSMLHRDAEIVESGDKSSSGSVR